ncbi:MAG: hypothetical protein ABGZ17_26195 [Planctomycetaceae bacterium]
MTHTVTHTTTITEGLSAITTDQYSFFRDNRVRSLLALVHSKKEAAAAAMDATEAAMDAAAAAIDATAAAVDAAAAAETKAAMKEEKESFRYPTPISSRYTGCRRPGFPPGRQHECRGTLLQQGSLAESRPEELPEAAGVCLCDGRSLAAERPAPRRFELDALHARRAR